MGLVKLVFLTCLARRESHCYGEKNCPYNVSSLSNHAVPQRMDQNVSVKFTKTE
jgi:hypothetical protein